MVGSRGGITAQEVVQREDLIERFPLEIIGGPVTPDLTLQARDLIPDEWHHIKVDSDDDLLFLGKSNIRAVIRFWRRKANALSPRINRLSPENAGPLKRLKNIFERKIARLLELEQRADEKPVFPLLRSRDEWLKDVEQLDVYSTDAMRWQPSWIYRYKLGDPIVCVKVGMLPAPAYSLPRFMGVWLGYRHPWMVRRDEWLYLRGNPDYVKIWIASCEVMNVPLLAELEQSFSATDHLPAI